jgi:hypothetical protein
MSLEACCCSSNLRFNLYCLMCSTFFRFLTASMSVSAILVTRCACATADCFCLYLCSPTSPSNCYVTRVAVNVPGVTSMLHELRDLVKVIRKSSAKTYTCQNQYYRIAWLVRDWAKGWAIAILMSAPITVCLFSTTSRRLWDPLDFLFEGYMDTSLIILLTLVLKLSITINSATPLCALVACTGKNLRPLDSISRVFQCAPCQPNIYAATGQKDMALCMPVIVRRLLCAYTHIYIHTYIYTYIPWIH